jgi:thioesterase domain-containing protein
MRCAVEHQPASTIIEVVTPIWQRVLQRPSIRVDDDFFELGGTPALAMQLFSEIAQTCGRQLPPEMIYQAPTIAALAALLEQPATQKRVPPLMLLQAGTEEPPVFLAHGLGGSVLEFFELARHLESSHPIYGMPAKGTDGLDAPLERVEDMAQFFLDAIRERQPHGPYLLVGHSLGGLVMLEIAQRLTQNGERVALLAMLDAYPHRRYLSLRQRVRLTARLVKRHASVMMQLPMRQAFSYLVHPSERMLRTLPNGSQSALYRPSSLSPVPVLGRVRDGAYLALTRYRPCFYRGKIKFVRAQILTEFPDDPVAVWAPLTTELEVETVPGDHQGMLATHFRSLASTLSRYLKEALCQ